MSLPDNRGTFAIQIVIVAVCLLMIAVAIDEKVKSILEVLR